MADIMGEERDHVFQKPERVYEPKGRLDPAGFARHVRFAQFPPPDDLGPFVEHFWSVRWDMPEGAYHSPEVMHRPYVDIFVSVEQSGIQGTFRGKRIYLAAGRGRILGARFRPGAFRALWPGDPADLQDRFVDLDQVFPEADERWAAHVLSLDDAVGVEALALLIRSKNPRPDPHVELIDQIIAASLADDGMNTVAAVAAAFGQSERWLQQLFRNYLGVGLKWLLQRNRLVNAARLIRETDDPDWAAIAYDLGYSSQQHFITDFRQVVGMTPAAYKRALESP